MLETDALDSAREVGGPAHRVGLVATDPQDRRELVRCQVLVPPELLEHAEGEFWIAVSEVGTLREGILGQQRLAVAFGAEACAERATTLLHVQRRVVENGRAGGADLGLAPAGPGQA